MKIWKRHLIAGSLTFVLSVVAHAAVGAAGGNPGTGAAAVPGNTGPNGSTASGSMATSNGTNALTNPSSIGSATTPPEQLGTTVGSGNKSKSDVTNNAAVNGNQDYQNAVRLYGANSDQARAASTRATLQTQSGSRSSLTTTNGQTPNSGTFAPSINSGSGATGASAGVGTGAGMATGTGTGMGMGSTNGSPVAH